MRTTRRQKPRAAALALVMIVGGLGGLFLTSGTASADVDSVEGTGFGLSVEVAGGFLIPPTPDPTVNPPRLVADETSTDFGPHASSVVTLGGILGILNNGVSVGPVSTAAANIVGENHLGSISTSSQVANVSILADAINIPLIVSSCTSNGDGSVGNTTISNARIGTTPLLNGPVAPNTVIDVLGLATIVLNEQIEVNTPPAGGNPGRTQITVNAARISIPADGSIAEIILAQSFCRATGPDVLLPPTTASTVAPTTQPTVAPTTSPTVAPTTSPTVAPTTAPTVAPTVAPTTTPPTTAPPTGTSLIPVTSIIPVTSLVPVQQNVLVRTGSSLQPLAILSGLSIVLGILLLIGTGRPLTANVGGGGAGYALDGVPEKWGPVEIAKTIWSGLAALMLTAAKLVGGGWRRRKD